MRWQYQVAECPTRFGTGAFVPVPAQSYSAAFNGQNIVEGAPGTVAVYSPPPASLDDGQLGGPFNQPSRVSPDYIFPSIYVAKVNPTMHYPGAILGSVDHTVPVPAGNVTRLVGNFMHRWRIGGRTVTRAIRPFTQWPTYGGGVN